jgi:putative spermidine/putrescine transport system permease protein
LTALHAGRASLGGAPHTVFFVVLPLIRPNISGGVRHIIGRGDRSCLSAGRTAYAPRQMFAGIREQISPTITAAASVLIVFSTIMLVTVELLRRRGERLRGIKS